MEFSKVMVYSEPVINALREQSDENNIGIYDTWDDLGLDSLDRVEVIMGVEEAIRFELTEDIVEKHIYTDVSAYMQLMSMINDRLDEIGGNPI